MNRESLPDQELDSGLKEYVGDPGECIQISLGMWPRVSSYVTDDLMDGLARYRDRRTARSKLVFTEAASHTCVQVG